MDRIKMATVSIFAATILAIVPATPADAQISIQQGLVNVTVQEITVEDVIEVSNNNVNVTVAANIIAEVCGITVPVAVLAEQIFSQGGFTCSVEDVENDITTVLTATQARGRR